MRILMGSCCNCNCLACKYCASSAECLIVFHTFLHLSLGKDNLICILNMNWWYTGFINNFCPTRQRTCPLLGEKKYNAFLWRKILFKIMRDFRFRADLYSKVLSAFFNLRVRSFFCFFAPNSQYFATYTSPTLGCYWSSEIGQPIPAYLYDKNCQNGLQR